MQARGRRDKNGDEIDDDKHVDELYSEQKSKLKRPDLKQADCAAAARPVRLWRLGNFIDLIPEKYNI